MQWCSSPWHNDNQASLRDQHVSPAVMVVCPIIIFHGPRRSSETLNLCGQLLAYRDARLMPPPQQKYNSPLFAV